MLKNLPLLRPYTIVRDFGSDVERFAAITFQNQPMRGHTGLDMAAAAHTPVYAAAGGLVLRAGNDAGGFGSYVLLHHPWGQTLYARLADVQVRQGEYASAGTWLGTIAPASQDTDPQATESEPEVTETTAEALPAHLHFGIRIRPYSLTDGWAGFVDPAPYLARLTTALGPNIGPHMIATLRPHLPTLARWQPRLILVLDPNPSEVAELRAVCPQAIIIARLYNPEHELDQRIRQSPQAAAQWAHELVLARWSPHVDYWQVTNEILQNPASLPLLNQFELARMALADQHGYKCAILAFSVGNPDLPEADRMADWRLVYPALEHAEQQGHIVVVHQYGMPTLWGPDNAYDWYIHRLEHQVLRRLPFKKLQFAVTEFGIDGLIRGSGPAGWKSFSSPEQYAAQLIKAGRYLERFCGRVLGYTVFTLGHFPPWGTYDIAGSVAEILADNLERGTWTEMNVDVTDIAPRESDNSSSPGPEALPGASESTDEDSDGEDSDGEDSDGEDSDGEDSDNKDSTDEEPGSEEPDIGDPPEEEETGGGDSGKDDAGDEDTDDTDAGDTDEDDTDPNDPDDSGDEDPPDEDETSEDETGEDETGDADQPDSEAPDTETPDEETPDEETPDEETPDGESPEPEEPPQPGKPKVDLVRRLSPWVDHYNIDYTTVFQPVAAAANQDPDALIYLVKDIFTTRNGSWEPDEQPGSVPIWARADYLKPLGAPDYFDDAGGDHHLFAAVIGLDGEFLRELPVAFWSDGLEQIQSADYRGYIYRTTKTTSGWANIVIGPGSSFVPERGEAGPWCWAPTGEAEIAVGGGLPANHHISTFVVWQAVRRADLFPTDGEEGEDGTDDSDDSDTGGDSGEGNDGNNDQDYSIHFPVIIR